MNKKVLIIDDDERNIFALSAVLKAAGYNCISAHGGLEGIELMKAEPGIAIALVDMMMPGMDGYELVQNIKTQPALMHIPVIAVTAQAMAGDKQKIIAAGADAYVSKPVNIDILLQEMNALLTSKQVDT